MIFKYFENVSVYVFGFTWCINWEYHDMLVCNGRFSLTLALHDDRTQCTGDRIGEVCAA